MRTAIIGDIGGQIDVFRDVLHNLGIDPNTCIIPDDLKVIQVGDVVRVSPSTDLDSLACAELADKLLTVNDEKYIQLLGNHETPLLGGVMHPNWTAAAYPKSSETIVRSWWENRQATLAAVLTAPGERDILVTHAGLTKGYMDWLGTLGVRDTVTKLNGFVGMVDIRALEKPGGLVTGKVRKDADIFWALVGTELHDSWWEFECEFNQIHGHATLYGWETNRYWDDIPDYIRKNTLVNTEDRFTITRHPGGNWVRSVDWVLLDTKKRQEWSVLILDGFDVFLG